MGISPQECQCFTVSGRVNGIVSPFWGFPGSPAGKESACNPGDLSSIPRSGRSPGEGIGYPLQHSWASLVAQMVKNLPAMQKTWVQSLGWEDPLEEDTATTPVFWPGESPWTVACQPLLSIGSQRVGQDWTAKHRTQYMPLLRGGCFNQLQFWTEHQTIIQGP